MQQPKNSRVVPFRTASVEDVLFSRHVNTLAGLGSSGGKPRGGASITTGSRKSLPLPERSQSAEPMLSPGGGYLYRESQGPVGRYPYRESRSSSGAGTGVVRLPSIESPLSPQSSAASFSGSLPGGRRTSLGFAHTDGHGGDAISSFQEMGALGSPQGHGYPTNSAAAYFGGAAGARGISEQSLAVLQRLQRTSDSAGTSSSGALHGISSYSAGSINNNSNGGGVNYNAGYGGGAFVNYNAGYGGGMSTNHGYGGSGGLMNNNINNNGSSGSYGNFGGAADPRWGNSNGVGSQGYASGTATPSATMQPGRGGGTREPTSYAAVVAAAPLSPQHLGNGSSRAMGFGPGADAPWQGPLSPPRGDGGPLGGGASAYFGGGGMGTGVGMSAGMGGTGMGGTMGSGMGKSLGMSTGGSVGMGMGTSGSVGMDIGAELLMAGSLARLDPVKQARLEISMREGFRSVNKMLKSVGAMLGDDVEDARAVAATRIQAIVRGWLVRARYKKALWAMRAWRRREFGPVRALLLGWVRRRDDLALHMQAMQAVRQKRTLKRCYYSWLRLVVDARAATSALLSRALAMAEAQRKERVKQNFKKWREIASGPNSRLNLLLRHERRSREAIERLRSMARETGWSGSISREMVRRELHNEAESIIRAMVQRNTKRCMVATWAGWVRLRAIVRSMSLQTLQREHSGYCTKVFAALQMAVRDRQQQWGPYWPRRQLWVVARRRGRVIKLRYFFSRWEALGARALRLRKFRMRRELRQLSFWIYCWHETLRLQRQIRRQVIDKWIQMGRATDLQPVKRWRMAVMEAKVLRRAQERAAENMRRRRERNAVWEHFGIWRGRVQSRKDAAVAAAGNSGDAASAGTGSGSHVRPRRASVKGVTAEVALMRSESFIKDSKAALAAITAELSAVNQRLAPINTPSAGSSSPGYSSDSGGSPGMQTGQGRPDESRRYIPPPSGGTDADEELRRLYRMVNSISGRLNELISDPSSPPEISRLEPAPAAAEPLPVVTVPAPAVAYGNRPAVHGGLLGDPLLRAMGRRTLPPSPLSQAGPSAHR